MQELQVTCWAVLHSLMVIMIMGAVMTIVIGGALGLAAVIEAFHP